MVQSEKAKKMRELKKFGKKVSGTCHVRPQQNLSTALRTRFSNETSVDSELVSLCRNVRLCMCVRTYVCAHLHMHACVCTCIHILVYVRMRCVSASSCIDAYCYRSELLGMHTLASLCSTVDSTRHPSEAANG